MLFGLSLVAELIANDRPILASYKGELLFPAFVDYPEEKFGGFLAVTDYRDPVIQDEIKANGWMLWPPIRYSYRTINNDIPEAGAGQAVLDVRQGDALPALSAGRRRSQLHDRQLELARHRRPGARRARPRHLRLSHLGPVRPHPDARLGASSASRPARCRAISAAGPTSSSSASSRSGRRSRCSICCSSSPPILPPGFFILLGLMLLFSWTAFVGVVRAEFLRARNFEYVNAARALGVSQPHHHVPASAAQRHGGDADLPAVHPQRLDHHADLARLPGLRPAARLGLARRTAARRASAISTRPGSACPASWSSR